MRPGLVGALALHSADRAVAEELAQEALARAWQRWPQVRAAASSRAWTYRVAFNLLTSWFRRVAAERRARRRAGTSVEAHEPVDSSTVVAVRAAVGALPTRRRTAVVLRYYLDLSVAETAEVMGCAEGTVKALCAQGIASLRDSAGLVDRGVTHDG